ncbi:hypothetical protein DL93DRAFT_2178674 [Clavulina sp. PMI_390]|nr:hypothetical protein DL93DRAFT_2178674 [Clavulina sp. PMI_390]
MLDGAQHDEELPSDEGEGDDVNPLSDDSSEEAATDEEEAQNVRKDFIVDDDNEEDDDSDAEEERHKNRRKRRRRRAFLLSQDDDLDLVAENTGRKVSSRPELSRLRRGRASPTGERAMTAADLSDDDDDIPDIHDIFEDVQRQKATRDAFEDYDMDGDQDDMDNFIDDEEDEVGADGMGEEERAERRAEKKRSEAQRKKAMGSHVQMTGFEPGVFDEIYEVFGQGDDYDWALDEEDMSDSEQPKDMKWQDVFEPSEIAARYLTADDDVIRATDVPERMQLNTSSLSPHATLGPSLLNTPFPESEINNAAEWVATRLPSRIRDQYFVPGGMHNDLLHEMIIAVTKVIKYILVDFLEVPYIWAHRRDHFSHFVPGKPRVTMLERDDLWRVNQLAGRFRALWQRRIVLDETWQRMGTTDDYYENTLRPGAHLNSVEGVSDTLEWLSMKHKKPYQDAIDFASQDAETGDANAGRQKKPSRITQYDLAKSSVVSRLASSFGLEPSDVVRNVVSDRKQFFTEDQQTTPLIFAEAFVSGESGGGGPATPEDALQSARMILATELGKDPLLRQVTRDRFKSGAVVSVKPTEKGVNKIDDQHPYAPFKYLLNKPVSKFASDTQWLHILAAEADHLVTVEITLSQRDETAFRDSLFRAISSDGFSDAAIAWNHQRGQIIEEAIEKHLYAMGVKHVREWLKDEVEELLGNRCAMELEARIDVAPYRPRDFEKGEIPAVLALSWGKGDPQKDAIFAVFMDEAGHVREQIKFDNLIDPDARKDFQDFVKKRKPDVVAVGGFSILSVRLFDRVKEVVGHESELAAALGDGEEGSVVPAPSHDDGKDKPPPVIWVPDAVARVFQHSRRGAEEFNFIPVIGRYCVGLARYVQSPLSEYVAMGADINAISFNEDQQLLPNDKLLSFLERALINIVNDVGLDINRAVMDPYYRYALPFIAGLGPRKAQAMVKRIGQLGTVMIREEFITKEILTAQVFINAVGFLKTSQDEYDDGDSRGKKSSASRLDPLDATRIHPEDYDLARKMASGALELDEEDFVNQHPSLPVMTLQSDENSQAKLDALNLDEFAQNLLETNDERKRHTLDVIHDELLNPFGELRPEFPTMTDWEILTMLTGETKRTLAAGRILTVTVSRIKNDGVDVRYDNGIEGSIARDRLSASHADPGKVVKLRQSIQAVIESVKVQPGPRVSSVLIALPDAIELAETNRQKKFDEHYNSEAARQAQELQERRQRSEANRTRRVIKHPSFKNFNSREAENWLAPLQHGDALIRPSSKGPEHLAVTWKVADGVFQHIDVVESGMETAFSAGPQYTIDGRYTYSDLDDLLVNHVKAMSRKVDDLMASEKYKGGTPQELTNWLTNFVKMNPNRSSYAFGLNRQKPGYFNLSFLANIDSPVQTWQVKVTPTAYRLGEVEVGSVADLCDAFKRK